MKTAFSILPEPGAGKRFDLLIEAGRDCIAMLWYSKETSTLEGFSLYQPGELLTDDALSAAIQRLLATENFPNYDACRIFFNFKESVLIPSHLQYQQGREDLLQLMFGEDRSSVVLKEDTLSGSAINLYRVPAALNNAFNDRFYGSSVKHSNSCQLAAAKKYDLYCIVYPNSVKIILHKDGRLQLAQLFDYKNPSDVSYYLLQACKTHEMNAAQATICLSGFVDKDSQLYQEIYRYFMQIDLLQVPGEITVTEKMQELPSQFYSFLIPLLQCGS